MIHPPNGTSPGAWHQVTDETVKPTEADKLSDAGLVHLKGMTNLQRLKCGFH